MSMRARALLDGFPYGLSEERGGHDEDARASTMDPQTTTPRLGTRSLTLRAVLVGLVVGLSVTVSNIYFGLQIGFTSQMSMQSSLLGFSAFTVVSKHLRLPLTPQEKVVIQTVPGAVGCIPVTAGLIGVVPALEFLLSPA